MVGSQKSKVIDPMRPLLFAAVVSSFVFSPLVGASAQERYSMEKMENGTIRLNNKSGAVSYCREVGSGMTCSMAADERATWSAEMEAMAARIELLEQRLAQLETKAPPADAKPDAGGAEPKPGENLTEKEERQLDKAMRVAEKMMRRMIGVVKELKRDFETN